MSADPVTGYLERHGVANPRVVPLTGDASDRRYFRILPRQGDSFVLAVYAAPFEYATLPFVNVHSLLDALPVPIRRFSATRTTLACWRSRTLAM
jgi:hypothetical protein